MSLARVRALVLVGVLGLLALLAVAWAVTKDDQTRAADQTPCVNSSVPLATAIPASNRSVTVNVFNATPRAGLAAEVAAELRARGFTVKTVGNDPLGHTVNGAAEIRFGLAGAGAAQLLRSEAVGAVPVVDARPDATIDLVIGDTYTRLASSTERQTERAKLGVVTRPAGLC
jgi:hypothetical protein